MTRNEELQRACRGAMAVIEALLATGGILLADNGIDQEALRLAAEACREALDAAPRTPRGRYLRLMFSPDLARARCATPGCDHSGHGGRMFLHAHCHPAAAVEAAYNLQSRALEISCAVCKKAICAVAVDGPAEART